MTRTSLAQADGRPFVATGAERARLGRFYDEYARFVAWFASRVLAGHDEVEDIVHEVFLIAANNLDRLSDPAEIRGWLKTVTIRQSLRRLRWRRVRAGFGLLPPAAIDDTLVSPQASPEDRVLLGVLLGVLQTLPTPVRVAWSLRYLHEETVEQVAALCSCSLATAKRRIAAAQKRIKRSLGDD